ncbi:MAG: SRPBCC family protein [Streptosporangiaceae bacterium]
MNEVGGPTEPFTTEVDLPAPVEEVYRHLTDPAAMVRWMGQHAKLEPVPGGAFEVDINGVPVRGHYLEVDPPRRVLVSWGVTGNSDLPPGATQVEFTLTHTAEGTRLRIVHRGLPPEQASMHEMGWQHFVDRLVSAVRGVDPGPDPWGQT